LCLWEKREFSLFLEKKWFKKEVRKKHCDKIYVFMPKNPARSTGYKKKKKKNLAEKKSYENVSSKKRYPCVWFEPGKVSQTKCSNFSPSVHRIVQINSSKLH